MTRHEATNMPPVLRIPLVGAYHHPPATLILPLLAAETNLILRPNPTNPYDPDAVEVYFNITETETFNITNINEEALLGMGYMYDDLVDFGEMMLGFLARQQSSNHPRGPTVGNTKALEFIATCEVDDGEWSAKLAFAPDGKPLVCISLKEKQEKE